MLVPTHSRSIAIRTLIAVGCLTSAVSGQEILVAGFNSGIHRFDFNTGAFLGTIGNVNDPLGITQGPDGNIYVAEEATDKVLRFDGNTFEFIDEFVADDPSTPDIDENAALDGPSGILFGDDGHLYVASFNNDRVLRFDGTTGAFLGRFVDAAAGTLNGPDAGMAWGPDGHLYIPSFFNHKILKFDGKTGDFIENFVNGGQGGLTNPRTIAFRQDGTALVASEGNDRLLQYGADGSTMGIFADNYPSVSGFAISPTDGNVYATSAARDNIRRFDGLDGSAAGVLVTQGGGGLDAGVFLTFHQNPYLHLTRLRPGTSDVFNSILIENATPGATNLWIFGTQTGTLQINRCPNLLMGILDPSFLFTTAGANGVSFLGSLVDDDFIGFELIVQAYEPSTCRVSNLVIQTIEDGGL